ncbi:tRNA pseudouridine synthase-like 1 isoform X2 [Anabrus simplex]|uniref:tRNA pseudouridine synthase-like 1 isoform X2 n=1 Tax=Anabrus simplex TaxID=316456 RepID=UPI0034DD527F
MSRELFFAADQGVHALKSAVHVDLEAPNGKDYDPKLMIYMLNRCFDKHKIELRVQSCKIVPETFHARHSAKLRSYLYRLAVRRSDAPLLEGRGNKYLARIPYAEWKRCHFIQKTEFDVEKLRSAASLFPGVRDFRTFMGRSGGNPFNVCTVRDMHSLNIAPGQPLLATCYSPCNDDYCFWDITCSAKSFLYRQVRRIVGALVAVAQGSLPIEDIQFMLDNPNGNNWNPKAVPVPACGLYLMNVEYDPADMLFPVASISADDNLISVNSVLNPVIA